MQHVSTHETVTKHNIASDLCMAGKGGVKFIVHWLDHIIYPILMQIVCLDALNVSHKKDQTFFRNKWEYLHGMAVEEVGMAQVFLCAGSCNYLYYVVPLQCYTVAAC